MDELSVANWTVLGTFLLACLLILINYLRMRYGKEKFPFQLTDGMIGKPTWDFSTSWATTLTAVSALLSTVLAAGGLTHVESDTGLSLFFGMLVLICFCCSKMRIYSCGVPCSFVQRRRNASNAKSVQLRSYPLPPFVGIFASLEAIGS